MTYWGFGNDMHYRQTSLGWIGIDASDGRVTHLLCAGARRPAEEDGAEMLALIEAFRQLEAYLAGTRRSFDLPLAPAGTPFQRRVWQALVAIPYGQTASYGAVAKSIGNPKACRAVGMANNRNPIPIFIPCHRVIGANGDLVGYGSGLPLKKRLLDLEACHA
jgi:methylated-DNA-[protein]-cysteine S-methyltransferase